MTKYDTEDPLGMLMQEWNQMQTLFWGLLVLGTVMTGLSTRLGELGAGLGPSMLVAALGLPLIKLGPTVVIVGNELRKAPAVLPPSQDTHARDE